MITACLLTAVLAGQPDFEVACKRDDDTVETAVQAERAVFTVTSPRGIGAATVHRRRPSWPATVNLRLRLHGLESLTVTSGQVTLGVSVSSSPPHEVRLHVSETGQKQEEPVDRHSRYWTDVRLLDADGKPAAGLPANDGWFDLQLPPALLATNPSTLEIRWIDFYRN